MVVLVEIRGIFFFVSTLSGAKSFYIKLTSSLDDTSVCDLGEYERGNCKPIEDRQLLESSLIVLGDLIACLHLSETQEFPEFHPAVRVTHLVSSIYTKHCFFQDSHSAEIFN